jgi:hypothetical protein
MLIFKTKWFHKWAAKQGMADDVLLAAVDELNAGLLDADLGGHVIKKRLGLPGRGKRGGIRVLVAFRREDKVFFIYGFAKKERANISAKELTALKLLASELLGYTGAILARAVAAGELIEVRSDV